VLKKLFYISILLIFITVAIFPKQITFDQANTIAENWTKILEEKFSDQVRIKDAHTIYKMGNIVSYVFEFYPKGFMIVSAEDYFSPVKFYSLKYDYKSSTKPLEELIFDRYSKVIDLVKKGKITLNKEIVEQNRGIFKRLLNSDIKYSTYNTFNDKKDITLEVKPLLTSEWGQYSPYNNNCPVVDGIRAPAGCVSIAFSQIFNYWEWPDRGVGSFSYYDKDSKRIIYANFDKEYQWWYMEDKRQYSEESKKAVAELCYDVSVASISGYNSFGTGSSGIHISNYISNLKYSPDMKVESYLPTVQGGKRKTPEEWFNIAKNQIDNKQPCAYGISTTGGDGHEVIIDGYRISDGINMVHINFGWSSAADGYYQMDKIVTKAYDFSGLNQDMIINIYPYPGYKKPTGKAPDEITGYAKLNKSAFLTEYVCELTWSESPSEDKRIREYIIYRQKDGSIEEFARVEPKDGHSYTFRVNDYSSYVYSVGVIDKNGVISDISGFVNLLLEN